MPESKYGQLFTEDDVKLMLAAAAEDAWNAVANDQDLTTADIARRVLDADPGDFTFPADEPLFLLRGQDRGIASVLAFCADKVGAEHWCPEVDAIAKRCHEILAWQRAHMDRVTVPN